MDNSKHSDTDEARHDAAHNEAFDAAVEYVEDHVISNNNVVKLLSLKLIYTDKLKDYRSEKLMKRLQNHPESSSSIAFTKITEEEKGCRIFYLVHNSGVTVGDAVCHAYKLASIDKTNLVALLLRNTIRKAFRDNRSSVGLLHQMILTLNQTIFHQN